MSGCGVPSPDPQMSKQGQRDSGEEHSNHDATELREAVGGEVGDVLGSQDDGCKRLDLDRCLW